MQPIDEIERLRKGMLVGSKRGNRFLEGFSRSAIVLHSVDLEPLWVRLIEDDQKLKVRPGIPAPVIPQEPEENLEQDTSEEVEDSTGLELELVQSVSEGLEFEESQSVEDTLEVVRSVQTASSLSSLKRLMRKANDGLEERGFNFLNLCVGKVHWKDDKHSGYAPALLIPVRFIQTAVRLGISIEFSDEAIQWNPALLEKLRTQLPPNAVPEELFADFSAGSFEEIQAGWVLLQACLEEAEWTIEEGFALNLLETSQIQLYRDLDTSEWNSVPKLIQQTLGTGFVVDTQLQSLHAGAINRNIQAPESLPLILDADPTQLRAIAIAESGGNLVIQGPPGTGKSQTIANIIATMAAKGKRVLFVAQKKAALDVVYQRLCKANLEHMLLELHSIKSKRKSVLQSLSKARNQGGIRRVQHPDLPTQTIGHRRRLEQVNGMLQQPIGQTERTLSDIFFHAHQSTAVHNAPILTFEKVLEWDVETVNRLQQTSIELSQLIQSETLSWTDNPFRSVQTYDATLMRDDRIFESLQSLKDQLRILQNCLRAQEREVGCHFDGTFGGVDKLLSSLEYLVSRPSVGELNWTLLKHAHRWEEALELISHGQALGETQKRLEVLFEPTSIVQYKRIETLFAVVEQLRTRWWKVLHPKWWSTLKHLSTFFKGGVTPEEVDGPIQELEAFHLRLVEFEKDSTMGGVFFGELWKGIRSDWLDLQRRLQWLKQFPIWAAEHPNILTTEYTQSVQGRELAHLHGVAIKKSAENVRVTLKELGELLKPLDNSPMSLSPTLNLQELMTWLTDSNLTRSSLARAIAINQVCRPLREVELESWIRWIMGGESSRRVAQHWEFIIGHSRKYIVTGMPNIQRLIRSTLQTLRNNYIEHDEKLSMYAQENLVAEHIAEVQSLLSVGQLSILTSEMSKSRSRLSIRWLMSNCGQAIQRLKPVMMMSPISVATHLPKEMEFDVVLFDEASQMTTPFALGALMRAKQAIVVGDSQQLSPTSFFQKSSDMESILDRFVANGCPSIRLSFHYRSRHPSLISISNQYMYDGGLKPFPTPNTHPLARGVRLISSAGCVYDRGGSTTNPKEAEVVVATVASRITEAIQENTRPSIGIVAFSLVQREVLQDAWEKLVSTRSDLRKYCDELPEGEHLFIKNLEDVQGDERDIIFISVGYGLDGEGKFTHNFGPVGRDGGDRRLNVLFSRSRYEMILCANFESHLITSNNKALQMLKSMLELSVESKAIETRQPSGFIEDVCLYIESVGFNALPNYGPEGNTIDIAVQDPQTEQFKLAILCEGGASAEIGTTRHRERMFSQSLKAFGWPVYRVWSLPWYTNPKSEQLALSTAIKTAAPPLLNRKTFVVTRVSQSSAPRLDWVKTQKLDLSSLDIDIPADAQPKTHPHLITVLMTPLLKQEGPLSRDMIVTRICQMIPSRRTSRNRAAVDTVLRQLRASKSVVSKYGFYWHSDSDLNPRVPLNEFRDFGDLYPPHVLTFVRFYLNGSVEKVLSLNETAGLLMNLVGWSSIGKVRLQEYCEGIVQVIADSDIDVKDGVLSLGT